jgi:glycosyltransferase involved in cell wall biosynthesis
MRIAYVCADPGVPVFGRKGSSVHVQEVIRGLVGHGATIELFATRTGGERPDDLDGMVAHRLPEPTSAGASRRERELLRQNSAIRTALEACGRFDLVYERHALWSHAAMEFAVESGTPGLLEVNAPLITEQRRHRQLVDVDCATSAAMKAFRAASAVLAVSREVAAYVACIMRGARVVVLPNGVDPDRITPTVKASRPGSASTVTFGFVGTLKPWHGLDTLIDGFALTHQQRRRARLLIVGEGPERQRITARARLAGCVDAVEFTGGVDHSEIPALLTSLDVGVAPYAARDHSYFSPLKLYEYMAAGLPIVASDIGQAAEVIQDGTTGLLCPPGDSAALATSFVKLIDDPKLRQFLGRNARAAAEERHTWRAVTAQILQIAGDVVRNEPVGAPG